LPRPEDYRAAAKIVEGDSEFALVELAESSWCCGSAGIYNLIQPEMADQLLDRKMNHIRSTGAAIVATGNPAACCKSSTARTAKA